MASNTRITGGGGFPSTKVLAGNGISAKIVEKHWDIVVYGPPNKAIAGILMGDKLAEIVGDYTVKVAETYKSMLGSRTRPDTRPSKQGKGHLIDTVTAYINPNDGLRKDRWVGVVSVGSPELPYGGADEYGRNKYAQYEGRDQLNDALRMHLPHKP